MMKIVSALALAGAAHASGLSEASRRLQGAADTCSPSDAELLTLIEIVLAQNEKLTQQTSLISCITGCQVSLDAACDCAGTVVPSPPAPPGPVTPAPAPPSTDDPTTVNSGLVVNVSPEYQASFGDDAAFADCFLTPEEIASDPEAAAFAAAFIQTMAAQMGVDASAVELQGISTDGDDEPGCDGTTTGGAAAGGGMVINVTPEFSASMGDDAAFNDCFLTPEEIASDPEAAAFAAAFIASTAASLGIDPATVSLGGISTAGQPGPGCGTNSAGVGSTTSVVVGDDYAAALADSGGFDDCRLSAAEIAADTEAAALAQAFAETQAAAMGVPVSDITITSIEATDGQGCGQAPHAASSLAVAATPEFVNSLGAPGFLDDCYITVEEYNSNANAQALVDAFIATQAATLGIPASSIAVSGISTDDDDVMGCSTTGRRMQTTGHMQILFNDAHVNHAYSKAVAGTQNRFVSSITLK